jgi:hypothetical protein
MRPIILLDAAAAQVPENAEAIIAHELAHVVQFDWAKLILARIATAAFWFNPLAWVLAGEAHQLREEAADDAVLAANIPAPDYADLLISVARHQCRGTLLGAHGVAPSKNALGRRVRRVLDQNPARGLSGRLWIAGFATAMLSTTVPLAAVTILPSHTAQAAVPAAGRAHQAGEHNQSRSVVATHDAARAGAAAREADAASDPIDEGQPNLADGLNVSLDYQHGMADAGFPNLSIDQLADARAVGVTPDFARAMRATGMPISIRDLIEARAMGLDPSYVVAMRRFGINGTLYDYQGMWSLGVTPSFVSNLRKRGRVVTSPHQLTELLASKDDPDP